jgi:hypothetical protein
MEQADKIVAPAQGYSTHAPTPCPEVPDQPRPPIPETFLLKGRSAWWWVGVTLAPFATISAYLLATRSSPYPLPWAVLDRADWAAVMLGVGLGVICLLRVPLPLGVRLALTVVYVPMMAWLLLIYSLYSIGMVYGKWL